MKSVPCVRTMMPRGLPPFTRGGIQHLYEAANTPLLLLISTRAASIAMCPQSAYLLGDGKLQQWSKPRQTFEGKHGDKGDR